MKIINKAPLVCTVLVGALSILNTGCKSYNDVATRYTSKHIKENTNHVTAYIPETSELGYILYSLTDVANKDTLLINKNTAYYKEVAQHFAAFKNHKAVQRLNADLKATPTAFTHFRNGLYALKINERNRLVIKTDYRVDLNPIDFKRYTSVMEDFIADSKFRQFYANHADLYTKLIQNKGQQLTMSAAWASIAKQYNQPFQSYQVIVSPLIKGYANSLAISGRGFRECIIFAESTDKALTYSPVKNGATGKNTYND